MLGNVRIPLVRRRDSIIKPNIVPIFLHRTDNGVHFGFVLVGVADKDIIFVALIGTQDFIHISRPFCRIWMGITPCFAKEFQGVAETRMILVSERKASFSMCVTLWGILTDLRESH